MSLSFSGFNSHSSYSSGRGANPASTEAKKGVDSPGFTPAALMPNPGSAANLVLPQTGPRNQHGYRQPSVQREPSATSYSNVFAASVQSRYAGSSSAGSVYPGHAQSTFNQGN